MDNDVNEPCRVGPLDVSGLAGERRLVHARLTGKRQVMTAEVVDMLLRCRPLQPLAAHARDRTVEGAKAVEAMSVEATLRELADAGFFVSDRDLRPHVTPATAARKIDSLVVVTSGDRQELARCLESYAANQAEAGRTTRLLVSDDATDPATLAGTATLVASVAKRAGTEGKHLTRRDRAAFALRLAQEIGIPEEVVRFALLGELPDANLVSQSRVGANRNTVLLATAGQRCFCVDDDTVCRLTPAFRTPVPGYSFESRFDPRGYLFHLDRARALADAPPAKGDLLALHESLLGRPLAAILNDQQGQPLRLAGADGRVVEDLCGARGRVVLTTMGVRGHSGVKWPTRLLEMEPAWAAQLLASEEMYRAVTRSQEMTAAVPATTLSNQSFFATMFFGLDNIGPLPPFMPVLRSQDILFWRTLLWAQADAYVGHLPWTLVHDPAGDRMRSLDLIWQHTGIELAYLLTDLITTLDAHAAGGAIVPPGHPMGRIAFLGARLIDVASQPLPDFTRQLGDSCRKRHMARLSRLVRRRRELAGAPAFWTGDVDRHCAELERLIVAPELPPPCDVGKAGVDGWRRTRVLVRGYGQVLTLWPEMVQGAERLSSRGQGLSRPS